jgi:hypothetical protein
MAYPKVGKYIAYKVDSGLQINDSLRGQLVNSVLPGQTAAATAAIYSKNMIGSGFTEEKPPWMFTFLKYVAGAVTTAPFSGSVMTGPMSGCYLFTYSDGGTPGVAHVGTADDPDKTKEAKKGWVAFAARAGVGSIVGASPFDSFSTNEYAQAMAQGRPPTVVGYFETGKAYAMLLSVGTADKMKLAAVKEMTMKPWDTIKTLPKFAG